MTAPLTRQNATTDLLALRVDGHSVTLAQKPQKCPRIVVLTAEALSIHDEMIRAATLNMLIPIPNSPTEETPDDLRAYNTLRASERLEEINDIVNNCREAKSV